MSNIRQHVWDLLTCTYSKIAFQSKATTREFVYLVTLVWPWPWPHDFDTWPCPRYYECVPACQKWSS